MRLVFGEPPTVADFHPEVSGWRPLKEPRPWTLVLFGSGLGIPLAWLTGLAWAKLAVMEPFSLNLSLFGSAARYVVLALVFLGPPLGIAILIAVHELCHALACPRWGMTGDTVIGAWPSKLLFYAGHLREVSRDRYLVTCLMPFLMLTLLPLCLGVFIGNMSALWAIFSTTNALVCGGDAIILLLVTTQVPKHAVLQNRGWATWWKPADPSD
jgi:hypothetical protein